jgi:hypothetical protein
LTDDLGYAVRSDRLALHATGGDGEFVTTALAPRDASAGQGDVTGSDQRVNMNVMRVIDRCVMRRVFPGRDVAETVGLLALGEIVASSHVSHRFVARAWKPASAADGV